MRKVLLLWLNVISVFLFGLIQMPSPTNFSEYGTLGALIFIVFSFLWYMREDKKDRLEADKVMAEGTAMSMSAMITALDSNTRTVAQNTKVMERTETLLAKSETLLDEQLSEIRRLNKGVAK